MDQTRHLPSSETMNGLMVATEERSTLLVKPALLSGSFVTRIQPLLAQFNHHDKALFYEAEEPLVKSYWMQHI